MKPVAIVTDSTSDIPSHLAEDLNITIVPLHVSFGEVSYRENVDLSQQEFYRFLALSKNFPVTSQPTKSDFMLSFARIPRDYSIISLHLSGKLSQTYHTACESEKSIPDGEKRDITVVDTGTAGLGLGMIAIRAAEMAREGMEKEMILNEIQNMISGTRAVAVLRDLSNLSRGGRIGKARAFFSDLLSVTPVVALEQGEVLPVARALGLRKGIKSMLRYVKMRTRDNSPRFMSVISGILQEEKERLLCEVEALFPSTRILPGTAGAVICTHLGSSHLSLIWH